MIVAALYIDPRGTIANRFWSKVNRGGRMLREELGPCWEWTASTDRDARLYDGPHPVVAHPPCGPWGRLRHLYRGTEHDCAIRAVEQVRQFGGVLEHPAGSKLWEHRELPPTREQCDRRAAKRPTYWVAWNGDQPVDEYGCYTIEVDQVEWGHVARKRTWLYLVGVPRSAIEAPPFPGREPTRSVSGRRGLATQAKHPNWKEQLPRCSDAQRRRTPPLFAEYLSRLARSVKR